MTKVHWHLRLTLESSAKEAAQETARTQQRSAANYVSVLVTQATQEKEPIRDPD